MKRRFRRRKTWGWANQELLTSQNMAGTPAGTNIFVGTSLLPPNRVAYLCDTMNRKSITHIKTLMWVTAFWQGQAETGTSVQVPPVNLYCYRSLSSASQFEADFQYRPYQSPPVPQALAAWDDDTEEANGLDPYLWTCPLFLGVNVGNIIQTAQDAAGDGSGVNAGGWQLETGPGGGSKGPTTYLGGALNVTNPWHPTFEIASRRVLTRDNWLVFGGQIPVNPSLAGLPIEQTTVTFNMLLSWRMLLA